MSGIATSGVSSKRVRDLELVSRYGEGDLSAREALIDRYMPLAKALSRRYSHTGEASEDLEQVAYVALIKAVDRYDPERGPFRSYAIPYVLGELKRHFRDKGWSMHVPRSTQERLMAVNGAIERLSGSLGRSPSPKEIAEFLQCTPEEVVEALSAADAYSPASLDAPQRSDPEGDVTVGDGVGAVDERFELVELGASVAPAFRALPHREQLILKLRFIDDLNQAEIAERVGISQMHVSRLLRRSLDRLAAAGEAGST
jgi:RNA polymerase sigma-B factor